MSDVAAQSEEEALSGEESEEGSEAKKKFGLKTLLMFGVPPLLILAAGGYFVFSQDLLGGGSESGEAKVVAAKPSVYMDMPEMVVNLSSREQRAQYLKIKVALEAKEQKALDALQPVMPRILDMFQVYLRELRGSDLDGSAGIFRLKEELLRRINLTIHPNRIDRVLFKEIIVQ